MRFRGAFLVVAMVVLVMAYGVELPSGMEFVSIPSGSFEMGSSACSYARPVHTVYIARFEMMTTEVTQGMWEEVMGTSIEYQMSQSEYGEHGLFGVGSDYPMYYVSWNDCQEFIDRLNDMDPGHTYRLPSESEWEYACRAGTTTEYYWGDSDAGNVMGRYCWYFRNSGNSVLSDNTDVDYDLLFGEWDCSAHPVAQKLPNTWGLYDMSGNVWEWCEDKWHSNYDGAPTNGSAWTSSGRGSYRVERGGAWSNYGACHSRSATRFGYSSGSRGKALGFRLVRD